MQVDLTKFIKPNQTVAVALSGGSDSMALLNYMLFCREKFPFNVIAINVEHGIRGEKSVFDTEFVKSYCEKKSIPLICYAVDSLKNAKDNKLSVEQSARQLRYDCFYKAIESGACDLVATAHHQDDNVETILFNLFRGTGLSGMSGIPEILNGKIIRPFLSVSKQEIDRYIKENNIPFVTDETNLSNDYTRNQIRHNIVPEILKIFPDAINSISRFSEIAKLENAYLDSLAKTAVNLTENRAEISLPIDSAILKRAVMVALKSLGVEKDWEKTYADSVLLLTTKNNGVSIDLKKGIKAIKEYDKIVLYKEKEVFCSDIPFSLGDFEFCENKISITKVKKPNDLKCGFFADFDKIPKTAVIRTKNDGDFFTKFGGGTKSLSDYLTDKKIPYRQRNHIPVLADGNVVLAIFGVAISEKIKVDDKTETVIEIK